MLPATCPLIVAVLTTCFVACIRVTARDAQAYLLHRPSAHASLAACKP
jgi:hypothetical protein